MVCQESAFAFVNTDGDHVVLKAQASQVTLINGNDELAWTGFDEAAQTYSASGCCGFVPSHVIPGLISFLQQHGVEVDAPGCSMVSEATSCQLPPTDVSIDGHLPPAQPQLDTSMAIDSPKRRQQTVDSPESAGASFAQNLFTQDCESHGQRRLEALLEKQNALLLRQIEVAEQTRAKGASAAWQRNIPSDVLKLLDGDTKRVFQQWRNEFRSMVAVYVAQCRARSKIQAASTNGELAPPFLGESRRTWAWPQYYLSIAQPLPDYTHCNAATTCHAQVSAGVVDHSGVSCEFDVNQAFVELRRKHAWELQNFVIGHQDACVDSLVKDLTLERQTKKLQDLTAVFTQEQMLVHVPVVRQNLDLHVRTFVEAVHRIEMQAAEKKLKEQSAFPVHFLFGLRVVLVALLLSAIAFMSHELLMHIFAIVFALGCGIVVLWEDVALLSVRLLFGSSLKRLEAVCGQVSQYRVNFPIFFWQ